MTNLTHVQACFPPRAIGRWESDGSGIGWRENDKGWHWFVPPIVVPAFISCLIIVRAAYLAYS